MSVSRRQLRLGATLFGSGTRWAGTAQRAQGRANHPGEPRSVRTLACLFSKPRRSDAKTRDDAAAALMRFSAEQLCVTGRTSAYFLYCMHTSARADKFSLP